MNFRRIPAYAASLARGVFRARPRDVLRLLADSPLVVKRLPDIDLSLILRVDDPAISKPLLCLGRYEQHVTDALLACLRDGARFVDVGANLGYYSLAVARRFPRSTVWSFEPDPQNYALLRANVALNGLEERVRTYPAALSDREEELFFSTLGNARNLGARFTAKAAETLAAHARPGAEAPTRVRALPLDRVLERETVDVVKVDVEGFEPAVFRGMEGLLRRCAPVIVTEFAPGTIRHISGSDPLDLLRFFERLRYRYAVIEAGGGLTDCGTDAQAVMARVPAARVHHVDLLLRPLDAPAPSAR
jgi:FkbM family methyltransferase